MGKYHGCFVIFDTVAISITSGFVLALHDLGACLTEQKKLEEAEQCLRKAIDIKRERLDYEGISSIQSKINV